MCSFRTSSIFAFVFLLLTAPFVPAQTAADATEGESPWTHLNVVQVKPERLTEWIEFQRNEVMPALKAAGIPSRNVWQTAVFGNSFEFVFATPIANFAQYDQPHPAVRSLGEEQARNLFQGFREFVVSSRNSAIQFRRDLSYEGEMDGPPNLAVVNSVSVMPGKTTEFENLLKSEVRPVMEKAGVKGFLVFETVFGGSGNEFVMLLLRDNFAQIDEGPPFLKVLGPEGSRKLIQKLGGFVNGMERSIVRYRSDLSWQATEEIDSN